jgi:ATP-dependent DNA helicase RecG
MSAATRGSCHYPLGSLTLLESSSASLAVTSKGTFDASRLYRSVSTVQGVGKTTEYKLRGLGIMTVRDLLLHLPFRHEPPSRVAGVADVRVGEEVTLRVRVVSCAIRETTRRRVKVLEALVSDATGSTIATWYNQAYLEAAFRERPEVLVKGVLVRKRGVSTFLVRRHEILGEGEQSRHILGLVPVYPSSGDLSVRTIRTLLHRALPELRHLLEPLPARLLARRRYPGKAEAVWSSHFPSTLKEAHEARARLAFEELLLLQLAVLGQRAGADRQRRALPLAAPCELTAQYIASLPYLPTGAQMRVIGEIEKDLGCGVPMRRLLHGDVGSGKTMVATYCLLRAVEQGAQAALMAPTEVLADQHYLGLSGELSALGVRVGLLKGSQSAAERRGTHALIQEGVRFRDLRVTVIDEQHRFGVRQREAILAVEDGGRWPHSLHMSATPIPRTLSLTLYGDLDVSVLDEMPPGRRAVVTRLVFRGSESEMWEFVRAQLRQGLQAYVVCPLIEESENLQAASARQTFADLTAGELFGFELRLLHGQLAPGAKGAAMAAYASGEAQVLVSTSVIEVGVDVRKASVMVIMGARRFGLSQLHQLRGRVGRGEQQSYCFLMVEGEDEAVLERLALFARTADGFELAEADLLARGEGQLFGEKQSGMGDLEVASLVRDRVLLEQARGEAIDMLGEVEREGLTPLLMLTMEASAARFGLKVGWMDRV